MVSGRDDGEPRGGGEDQREGQRQGAMEIRGGGGGLWAARSVGERGVAVVARVVVIVGRVVGRVPAATTTRGQRRRRRRGERGEQGCERHGAGESRVEAQGAPASASTGERASPVVSTSSRMSTGRARYPLPKATRRKV